MLVVQQTALINLSLSLKSDFCITDFSICSLEKLLIFVQKMLVGHELNLGCMYTIFFFLLEILKGIFKRYLGCITQWGAFAKYFY